MESLKNKTLLFVVRQTLGRIVKDIQSEQLERLQRPGNAFGLSFELTQLELDEVFINQMLGVGPDGSGLIRLAHGYINSFRGDLSFSSKGPRAIEIDGLQLVFDVAPQVECAVPTGDHKRSRSQRTNRPPGHVEVDASSSSGADDTSREDKMFSSLFMSDNLRKEVEDSVVLPALRESTGFSSMQPSAMINEGLLVFERNIKQIAHSMCGSIRNVNIILRIPPHGQRITPGQEPPEGTLELLISFQGGFELEDMHTDSESNVMRKRIRFSNFRIAVYPYGKRCTTRSTDEEVEESVDLGSVFLCSGRADDSASNELVLQFGESRGTGAGPEAFFNAKVTIKSFISVLSLTQLSRLVYIARALIGAPSGDRTDADEAAVASQSVKFTTTIRATCHYISCTLMVGEDAKGTKAFWESLQGTREEAVDADSAFLSRQHRLDLQRLLQNTPFYNVYLGGILVLLQPVTSSTNSNEDAFHDVFLNHGGRGCSVGISVVEVYERYGKSDKDNKGGRLILTTKRNNDTQPERRYRVAIVSRTTYPLTPSEAREYNCVPHERRSDGRKNCLSAPAVVVEHVLVKTSGAVLLGELDAGVLERLGMFWAQVQSILLTETRKKEEEEEEEEEEEKGEKQLQQEGEQRSEDVESSVDKEDSDKKAALNARQRCNTLRPVTAEDMTKYEQILNSPQSSPERTDTVPFRGDSAPRATTPYLFLRFFTLQLEGITMEMKFPVAWAPDPDYYGPLARRLWEHLCEEGVALAAPSAKVPAALGGADTPYLPITMSVYLRGLDVSVDNSGVLELFVNEGQLTLHDYMEGVQSNILSCVFDTAGKEPCISIRQREGEDSTGVPADSWSVPQKAHPPFSDAYIDAERLAESTCLIAVEANVRRVDAHFRQDELLLTLFYLDQVVDAVDRFYAVIKPSLTSPLSSASRGADNTASESLGKDTILSRIAVRLKVSTGSVTLWAPRLSSAGVAVGEPLWRCIPATERCRIDEEHLRHHYELNVSKFTLFAHHEASATLLKTAVQCQGSDLSFIEHMCRARLSYLDFPWPAEHPSAPRWGEPTTIFQSYSELYNRANSIGGWRSREGAANATGTAAPLSGAKDRQPLGFSICRQRNLEDHTETYDAEVQLDRICLVHQTAHEGDHWLFALLNFFSDSSVDAAVSPNRDLFVFNSQKSDKDEGKIMRGKDTGDNDNEIAADEVADDVQSEYGIPIATSANLRITLIDLLVEYKAFGTYSKLVGLAPRLELTVTIPSILSETTSVFLYLGEDTVSIFLHNDFQQDLLDYDREARLGSLFGSSKHGIAMDLKNLGFVLVLEVRGVSSKVCEDPVANATVYVNLTSEKPLYVEVRNLRASAFFAHDSLYYFRTLLSHYLGGLDTLFMPSPNLLVQRSGPYFEHVIQHESRQGEMTVVVHQLVPDYAERIDDLLKSSAFEIAAPRDSQQVSDDDATSSGSTSYLADFDIIDSCDEGTLVTPLASNCLPITWKTHDNLPVDLTKCCTHPNHLSVYNAVLDTTALKRYAARRAPLGTPVAVGIYLFDCDAAVHLYGGDDFFHVDVPQGYLHTIQRFGIQEEVSLGLRSPPGRVAEGLWSGMDTDTEILRGWHEGHHSGLMGGGRRNDEYIVGRALGIRVQVDLYSPGRDKYMQLNVEVRDGEVIDCIEGSSVRTLFMATLPSALRDHDSDLLELRWTTLVPRRVTPHAGILVVGKPEEELVVRLQPITVAVHRRALDLIPRFFEVPGCSAEDGEVTGDALQTEPLFFNKIVVHPVQVDLYVQFEGHCSGPTARGTMFEMCNYLLPSIERARVLVPRMNITACPVDLVVERILEQLSEEILKFHGIFMLCCGFQPLQLASDVSSAGADMLIAPLKEYRRSQNLFSALSRALRRFLQVLVAQSLQGAAALSHALEHTTASSIAFLVPDTELQPLSRGAQPPDMMDGLRQGYREFTQGFRAASNVAAYCLATDGTPVRLPVTAPVIMDGLLRGVVQVLRGMRNSIAPEMYQREKKIFKGRRHKVQID